MKIPRIKSIFVKLTLAYVLSFLLLGVGVTIARVLSVSSPNIEISEANVKLYCQFLAQKIGSPPNLDAAKEIATTADIDITIFGPEISWSSRESFIEPRNSISRDHHSLYYSRRLEEHFVKIHQGPYEYIFSDFDTDHNITTLWLLLASAIAGAIVINFLMVRQLLKPIQKMNQVALELGVHNWKQRVNPSGNDELSTLGMAMDDMADRIEKYIHSMHDLLTAVSHELRSPLTRMKVALEFVDKPDIRDSLNEEIDVLDKLTGDLLEQKRLSNQPNILNKEDFSVPEWLENLCTPYRLQDRIIMITKEGPNRTFFLDRARMSMALRNIIENTIKHAPDSPIHISYQTKHNNSGFVLEISDEGPGIPQNILPRIGEPFLMGDSSRSEKKSGKSFGLGLSIVNAVILAHGAKMKIENLKPKGLKISLIFGLVNSKPTSN